MKEKYNDIIHGPRHVSKIRSPMARIARAAQFSPFAALTGYDTAVKETARLTDERIELDQYIKEAISRKLQILEERLEEGPEIEITYFQPDGKKSGGSYNTAIGTVKKIDQYKHLVLMTNGTEIPIDEIISIDGEI